MEIGESFEICIEFHERRRARGIRWHDLEDGVKKELKEFYNQHRIYTNR
ncbi:MAG: hypothetical protein H6Q58_722 [Firmicutes bacterium]|nr:hypothetical protein [Bacillota bacterium]